MENDPRSPHPRIPAAILGATGAVGQRFVQLLDEHPWFQVVALTGSDRAVGQKYAEACHWLLSTPMPNWARDMTVVSTLPDALDVPLAFSALPSKVARDAEPLYAEHGVAVCSNASTFRNEPDVPLVLPEVNPEHTGMVPQQRQNRGWKGFIVTNANCTITGLTIALKPLLDGFGLQRAFVISMQAVSGAGYPGIASLDILGNVVPYIGDEEEKMEYEPRKILGTLKNGSVEPSSLVLSAHANRVPVSDGHMVCLSVELAHHGSIGEVTQALRCYLPAEIVRGLPSTPAEVIQVMNEPDRPQPRLDMMAGKGMTTVVGRIRSDPLLDYKMVILSHNTIRGAAGGSIYNAELLAAQGHIHG